MKLKISLKFLYISQVFLLNFLTLYCKILQISSNGKFEIKLCDSRMIFFFLFYQIRNLNRFSKRRQSCRNIKISHQVCVKLNHHLQIKKCELLFFGRLVNGYFYSSTDLYIRNMLMHYRLQDERVFDRKKRTRFLSLGNSPLFRNIKKL